MPSSCCDRSRGEEELQLCPNFFFLPPLLLLLLLLFPLDDTITEHPTLPPCWIIVITENSTKNSRTQSSKIHHIHTQMRKIFRKSSFFANPPPPPTDPPTTAAAVQNTLTKNNSLTHFSLHQKMCEIFFQLEGIKQSVGSPTILFSYKQKFGTHKSGT
jgi:hypothetical protein